MKQETWASANIGVEIDPQSDKPLSSHPSWPQLYSKRARTLRSERPLMNFSIQNVTSSHWRAELPLRKLSPASMPRLTGVHSDRHQRAIAMITAKAALVALRRPMPLVVRATLPGHRRLFWSWHFPQKAHSGAELTWAEGTVPFARAPTRARRLATLGPQPEGKEGGAAACTSGVTCCGRDGNLGRVQYPAGAID